MIHFRSLLSLGAIDDDQFNEPDIYRIRSQTTAQSARLSRRKRKTKQRLESKQQPIANGTKGKQTNIPPLHQSISTKLTRRKFFYPLKQPGCSPLDSQSPSIICEDKSFDEMPQSD